MTEVGAPVSEPDASPRPRRVTWVVRLVLVAVAAAVVSYLACLALASLVWVTTVHESTSLTDAVRAGGLLWNAAQGAPVALAATPVSLMPWGLGLVCGLMLLFGARAAVRRMDIGSYRDLGWVGGGVAAAAAVYALLAAWAADFTWLPGARVSPGDAALHAGLLALLAMTTGALMAMHQEHERTGRQLFPVIPRLLAVVLRAGALGALALLGVGALAVALSLMAHFDDSVSLMQSLAVGPGGALGLVLLCLAYVPALVVWGTAYVVGSGVVIGTGAVVSPFVAVTPPSALPPVPLLAAIPQQATPFAWLAPVIAICCGLAVGLAVGRGMRGAPRLLRAVIAVTACAFSGVLICLAGFLASGSLGEQRLAQVGPVPTTLGMVAFVLLVLGAVPASLLGPEGVRKKHLAVAPVVTDHEVSVVDA